LATWYHFSWQSYSFLTILELLAYSKLTKPLSCAHGYHGGCSLKSNSINIQFPKHTKADDNRIELAISCVKTMKKILREISGNQIAPATTTREKMEGHATALASRANVILLHDLIRRMLSH
jgi:hypothetical protein